MNWVFYIGLMVIALGGCSQDRAQTSQDDDSLNLKLKPSSLAIFFKDGSLKLGESIDSIYQKIPRPDNKVTHLKSLPATLSPPFKTHGWEKGNNAYAFITLNEIVYLALQTHEQVNKGLREQILNQYQKVFLSPDKKITGEAGIYWFWESNKQRLMICQAKDINQKWAITIALGINSLMDRLHMDPLSAQRDLISISKKNNKTY